MESLNILDSILLKSKGYEVALLTTYNFEIPFFERNILNRLEANNIRRFGLFVDSKKYIEAINSVDSSSIGKKYFVNDVDVNASFHPKLILLLGEKKARLIVTSANLTFTGYCYNNEIFNCFDYDENDNTYLSIIKDAYLYFVNLNKMYGKIDDNIFDIIKEYNYLHRVAVESNVKFISNYDKSVMDQIANLNINVSQIDIAVPFFDNDLNALKEIKAKYPQAKIHLYTQNKFSTFNFKFNEEKKILMEGINVFDTFKEIGTPAIYHGKVFRFITRDKSYILYGSANCTEAALFKSSNSGGNYECDILAGGSINEFDYFFDNFVLIDSNEKLSNRSIIYDKQKEYNFRHIPSDDIERIHFKYKKLWDNLKVYINQIEYKYSYTNDEIIIEVDNEVPYGIFQVEFIDDNNKETINAFMIYKNIISEYRNTNNRDLSITLEKISNSKSSEYIKYYKMLLDLVPYDIDSLKEVKDNIDVCNEAIRQKESDDDFDNEFVVDFDIPDEILNKQKEYNRIDSIKRGIIDSFKFKILSVGKNGMHGRNIYNNNNDNRDQIIDDVKLYIPLPEEIRFARYVKRLFKSILDTRYLEDSSLKNYVDNIILLINVIYTYNKENSTTAFNINDYDSLLLSFFETVYQKDFSSIDEDMITVIKILLIAVLLQIFQNKNISNKAKMEVSCRNVLLNYDRKFELKNNYYDFLDNSIELMDNAISYDNAKGIIDNLLNYKNEAELYELIENKIEGEVGIDKNQNMLIVNANTSEISKYMNTQNITAIFSEVKKRYRQTGEIDTLLININNNDIDITKPNPIESIKYIYNISSSRVERYFKNKLDDKFRLVGEERL